MDRVPDGVRVGQIAGIALATGIAVLHADAPYLFDGLTSRALGIVIVSAVLGGASLFLVARGEYRWSPWLSAAAVGSMVLAWGVAQYPVLLPETVTVADAAAPSGTLVALLVAAGGVVLLALPFLALLYVLDQRSLLPEESVD